MLTRTSSGAHCHWFILFAKVVRGHPVKWIARHCGCLLWIHCVTFLGFLFKSKVSCILLPSWWQFLETVFMTDEKFVLAGAQNKLYRENICGYHESNCEHLSPARWRDQFGLFSLCFFYLTKVSTVDPPSIPILDYVIFVYFFSPPWAPLTASD